MNFEIKDGVLKKYYGSTPDVIIPSRVTKIGASAFAGNGHLKSVIITGNVKIIDMQAFEYCCNLENVIILEGVTTIKYGAFSRCINLNEIVIPESVMEIQCNVFTETKWLENKKVTEKDAVIINGIAIEKAYNIGESVNLEGVKEIQTELFRECNQIKEFIISDNVKIYENALFTGNDFNICLKSNIMYVNISIKKSQMIYYERLFSFIGSNMEGKEYLFDDLKIPEYRYPLAVFMANSYESEFFRTFIDVHLKEILEYAEKNAPNLLRFIGSKD